MILRIRLGGFICGTVLLTAGCSSSGSNSATLILRALASDAALQSQTYSFPVADTTQVPIAGNSKSGPTNGDTSDTLLLALTGARGAVLEANYVSAFGALKSHSVEWQSVECEAHGGIIARGFKAVKSGASTPQIGASVQLALSVEGPGIGSIKVPYLQVILDAGAQPVAPSSMPSSEGQDFSVASCSDQLGSALAAAK